MTLLEILHTGVIKAPTSPEDPADYILRVGGEMQRRDIAVDVVRVGRRTTAVVLTEPDGWETVGLATTRTPWDFNVVKGTAVALEDAARRLTNGRVYAERGDGRVYAERGDGLVSPDGDTMSHVRDTGRG